MRNFKRFREMVTMADKLHMPHLVTNHIALGLMERTDWRLCAMAGRLSHESWHKASSDGDRNLLGRLIKSGDEHAKSLRWLQYCLAIEAPRYFWQEMDTYTIGVVPMGSTSTMHKEAKKLSGDALVEAKSNLPEGTLQLRIRAFSWHTLRRMVAQRQRHRLPEWIAFCDFAERITEEDVPDSRASLRRDGGDK